MKSVGIISEYNPFHNGHLYHAQQSKLLSQADVTIAFMSGNFVMRGEPALFNKFIRTQMALSAVDLVVELPTIASLSSGDYFGEMAIKLADYLDVNTISFGSEHGNINALKEAAQQVLDLENSDAFKSKLKEGKSYPRIINELIQHQSTNDILQSPNNILSIGYLKGIQQFAPQIEAITIRRDTAQHREQTIQHQQFASGSSIRQSIIHHHSDWENVVPGAIKSLYHSQFTTVEHAFPYIKYQLLTQRTSTLKTIYTMSEGLENRLISMIKDAHSFKDLLTKVKTKRYTYTHIQRILMNILLNIQQTDVNHNIYAARILGMNENGRAYLKYLKHQFPERHFITNINQSSSAYFPIEIKATHIYNLMTEQSDDDFNTPVIKS